MFVCFEGGDSVGKSTQVTLLAEWLSGRQIPHLITRQPGGTLVGNELRRLVLDPEMGDVDPRAEALMYAADKAQHVREVIRPALERGEVVVSDRYVDSMIAYQGAGRSLGTEEIATIAWWAVGDLRPDLIIVLDVDPAEAVATIERKDRLEAAGDELHRRARQHFLDLAAAEPERYLVLHARRSREDIAAEIRSHIAKRFRSHLSAEPQALDGR